MKKYLSKKQNTNIISGFCGVGKTTFCKENSNVVELECYKFRNGVFPNNYIKSIEDSLKNNDIVFISTDYSVIKKLNEKGYLITIVYPSESLKNEYLKRYEERGSSLDFIETLSNNWNKWLIELNNDKVNKKIKLMSNQYLSDIIKKG